jgi:hypothetical protein
MAFELVLPVDERAAADFTAKVGDDIMRPAQLVCSASKLQYLSMLDTS